MLKTGIKAPDFTLKDKEGHDISLHDFVGKKVVLYFYAKDNTAGCTLQAQRYSDLYKEITDLNAVIIGISKDASSSHSKFALKYHLPFILLSDPERKILSLYDVLKEKQMYGKTVIATVRTTYLLDEKGFIIDARENVKPKDDAFEVLSTLKTLSSTRVS